MSRGTSSPVRTGEYADCDRKSGCRAVRQVGRASLASLRLRARQNKPASETVSCIAVGRK